MSLLIVACARPQSIAAPPETSTARLRTAIVALNVTLSCHGGAFCREDVVRPDAAGEIAEDCARRGGTFERAACARADIAVSCTGSTEAGPVAVFAYAQDEASRVSDLCEAMGGELAR